MNKIIILIVLLVFSLRFSHSQHVLVEYKAISNGKLIEKLPGEKNSDVVDDLNKTFEFVNYMTMYLKANKYESRYWGNNSMSSDLDGRYIKYANQLVEGDRIYHTDLKKRIKSKWLNFIDKDYIIQDSILIDNWTLYKENKYIDKYLCYKAETFYEVSTKKGIVKKLVVAWYTIDIPYRHGPRGFASLPGLILELTDKKITLVAKKIQFKKFNNEISPLPKGEIMTKDEFNELLEEAVASKRNEKYIRN